jgi:predicted dinucleotide-binding enzyme
MRAIVIGSGALGSAVQDILAAHEHEVVSVARRSGDFRPTSPTRRA